MYHLHWKDSSVIIVCLPRKNNLSRKYQSYHFWNTNN